MALRTLISVEYTLPSRYAGNISFSSDTSLLDADVILFNPNISAFLQYQHLYQGKPSLDENKSFELKEIVAHWRKEIQTALDHGKTVFVIFNHYQEIWVHTGQKEFSGTGRYQTTTNIVDKYDNYRFLPFLIANIIPKGGKEIRPIGNLGVLSSYWKDFQKFSCYESYIDDQIKQAMLVTKTGHKTVGAIFRISKGHLVLLPPLKYKTRIPGQLAIKFVQSLLEIDKALKTSLSITPPPSWVMSHEFRIPEESEIASKLTDLTSRIEKLNQECIANKEKLLEVTRAKALLYEQGSQLEYVILECLNLMGFVASHYKDGESEFDSIFESPEGRFLGEAEGKDNSAINIDKLSQLERNIQEDFARGEVTEHAKGVLFGNAYRLQALKGRPDFFTIKCISGAKRTGYALVRTPDMFQILVYLRNNPKDENFKKRCRESIFNTSGEIVKFPDIPSKEVISSELSDSTSEAVPTI